jgi:hypothetical protein
MILMRIGAALPPGVAERRSQAKAVFFGERDIFVTDNMRSLPERALFTEISALIEQTDWGKACQNKRRYERAGILRRFAHTLALFQSYQRQA